MRAMLMSWTAILLSVAALGVAILGVRLLVPISAMDYPREWAAVIIFGVVGGTAAVAAGVYWLSDTIAARLISTPGSLHVEARPQQCMFCLASLPPDALACRDCGALVPTYHARSQAAQSAEATGRERTAGATHQRDLEATAEAPPPESQGGDRGVVGRPS